MDVASIASAYASFGGVLAGFAFAGLSFYVTRSPEPDPVSSEIDVLITRNGEPVPLRLIPVSAVAAAGFYAMASLGISTFLYANLAGEGSNAPDGQAETALLVYGAVLALSVLTLFYFMTLVLFERSLTKPAAKPAFWAGTIAGSIVVLRFLAGSAQAARLTRCPSGHPCHPGLMYTTPGITITLVVAALVFVIITLTRVLETGPLRRLLTPFARRPTIPSAGVFVTAVAVATLASVYINTRDGRYVPPGWLIDASYAAGITLIVLFALASGSVIYPRVHSTRLTRLPAPPHVPGDRPISWWRRIQAWDAGRHRDIVHLHYASGIRPANGHGQLIWKVPAGAKPGELATRFKVWHDKSPWRLGGELLVVTGTANTPTGPRRCVRVTLTIRSGEKVDIDVSAGPPVQVDGAKPSSGGLLRVEVQRLDSSPDDVVLCWLRAGGSIARTRSEDGSAGPPSPGSS